MDKAHTDEVFDKLRSSTGSGRQCLTGLDVKLTLEASGLAADTLARIWDLSDLDHDGSLDDTEFAVAVYLLQDAKATGVTPTSLPAQLVPPCKRK